MDDQHANWARDVAIAKCLKIYTDGQKYETTFAEVKIENKLNSEQKARGFNS